MLIVWALLLLAALGMCAFLAAGRRRGTRWAGDAIAAAVASGRGVLSGIGGQRLVRHPSSGGAATSRITVVDASASAEEIAAPVGGWAPALFAHSEPAPIEEITAPADGWAPPLFAHSEAAAVQEITAPAGGWAQPIHGLTPPAGGATGSASSSGARGRTLARWRALQAHTPATLGVAGGAIAAILAVAVKPQRTIGRRHR